MGVEEVAAKGGGRARVEDPKVGKGGGEGGGGSGGGWSAAGRDFVEEIGGGTRVRPGCIYGVSGVELGGDGVVQGVMVRPGTPQMSMGRTAQGLGARRSRAEEVVAEREAPGGC